MPVRFPLTNLDEYKINELIYLVERKYKIKARTFIEGFQNFEHSFEAEMTARSMWDRKEIDKPTYLILNKAIKMAEELYL